MAAGNASRFGENKLAARFDGQSLFSRALDGDPGGRMFARVTVVSQYPALLEEASLSGLRCDPERPAGGRHQPHHPPRHAGDGGLRR